MENRGNELSQGPLLGDASAAQDMHRRIAPLITQSQLALALILQKSKPEGVQIRDYCLQLRKNIQARLPSSRDQRSIAACEFWKNQYTATFHDKKLLEERVLLLEQKLLLGGNSDLTEKQLELFTISSHDESRPPPTEGPENTYSSDKEGDAYIDDNMLVMAGLRGQRALIYDTAIAHILLIVRKRELLIKLLDQTNPAAQQNEISEFSCELLSCLNTAIASCCSSSKLLKTGPDNRDSFRVIQLLMNHVVLSFQTSLSAMNELCRTISGRAKRFKVINKLVDFFRTGLSQLQMMAKAQAEHRTTLDVTERHAKRQHSENSDEREYVTSKLLARTIVTIIRENKWTDGQPGSNEILDGLLYMLLDFAGRLLSSVMFHESESESESDDLSEKLHKPSTATLILSEDQVKLECRHLVQILDVSVKAYKDSLPIGPENRGNDKLLLNAKKKLQDTLVKLTIGDDSKAFLAALKPPPVLDASQNRNIGVNCELYGPNWLVGSLWSLVGWELVENTGGM